MQIFKKAWQGNFILFNLVPRQLVQIYSMTMAEVVHDHVILCEFLERLGKATASSLFNLVPKKLGEELLQLERDIRQNYEEQMQTKVAQTGESEVVLSEEDDDKIVEMADLLDDIDVKQEKVEEELQVEMVVDLELDGSDVGGEGSDVGGEGGEGGEGGGGGLGGEGGEGVEVGGEGSIGEDGSDYGKGGEGGEGVEVCGGGEDEVTVNVLVEGHSDNWTPLKDSKSERAIKHASGSLKGKRKNTIKPKKCDICQKMCARKSELERHKLVHKKLYLAFKGPLYLSRL